MQYSALNYIVISTPNFTDNTIDKNLEYYSFDFAGTKLWLGGFGDTSSRIQGSAQNYPQNTKVVMVLRKNLRMAIFAPWMQFPNVLP
jgi:hypothetical protein